MHEKIFCQYSCRVLCVTAVGANAHHQQDFTKNDMQNLQDFLLARETADLSGKDYDLNDDGRWDVFDLCLMKREYLSNYDTVTAGTELYRGFVLDNVLHMEKCPELFTAYLHCSSQWDGNFENLVKSRTPVYIAVGENDEYYGSEPSKNAYDELHDLYLAEGLTEDEIFICMIDFFRGIESENMDGKRLTKT